MKTVLKTGIRFYQRWISPFLAPRCKFYPSCSSYFLEALENHGFLIGMKLGITRLLRCHPWQHGGYDPCPPGKHELKNNPQTSGSDFQGE